MIIFYVTSLDLKVASVRYRALLPALYLNRLGIDARVYSGKLSPRIVRAASCIVMVKAFNARAVRVCTYANYYGVPVVIDLCDDIFGSGYGSLHDKDIKRYYFKCIAGIATSVVTTTEVLAAKIRRHVPSGMMVHIIPDMVENREDFAELSSRPSFIAKTHKRPGRLWKEVRRSLWNILRRARLFVLEPREKKSPPESPPLPSEKIILWFGNHGTAYSDAGMTQLLWLAADIAALAKEFPLRLVVVSNNKEKFERFIKPLPFTTEYVAWTPRTTYQQLQRADVCVVPFGHDSFSQAKSPNRIILALSLGTPVVCTDLPSLGPLRDSVQIESWYSSLKTYFSRPDIATEHLAKAQDIIREHFSGAVISRKWSEIVNLARKRSKVRSIRPRLLCFIQIIQDLDLLAPIIKGASEYFDVTVGILVDIALTAPRIIEAVGRQGNRTFFVHESELDTIDPKDPRLACDLLITASESSAPPHRPARLLVESAKRANVPTFTLQHGVENIGLTYRDEHYDETVRFESDYVFTWTTLANLPDWVLPQTRQKIIPVGCPKITIDAASLVDFPLFGRSFIAVFENLHWSRYSNDFRAKFLGDLVASAKAFPETLFVLKPHHAGQWFTTRRKIDCVLPGNVVVIDPKSPEWLPYTADAFLACAAGAITTPSTTAFDATRYDKPVAIVSYDMDAEAYAPLPLLKKTADWLNFVQAIKSKTSFDTLLGKYREKVSTAGSGLSNILTVLSAAASGARGEQLLSAALTKGTPPQALEPQVSKLNRLQSLADNLSDSELAELNALLPWYAWIADKNGRAFGASYSSYKRASPGAVPDPRIVELDQLIPLQTRSVLEVGCFEGIHTTALCDVAEHVKACDVRISLVAKTAVRCAIMGARPELFLWDAEGELPKRDVSADVLHHVGVLYHLSDPVTHLRRLLPFIRHALLIDTHVALPGDELVEFEVNGQLFRVRRYREGGMADPFSGVHDHSNWLLLDDLIALIREQGFTEILVNRLNDQRNGPRVTLIAKRQA